MDVERISVDGAGVFGCALGVLRASRCQGGLGLGRGRGRGQGGDGDVGGEEEEGDVRGKGEVSSEGGKGLLGEDDGEERIEMRFCGVWRFDETGMAVEHWYVKPQPTSLVHAS